MYIDIPTLEATGGGDAGLQVSGYVLFKREGRTEYEKPSIYCTVHTYPVPQVGRVYVEYRYVWSMYIDSPCPCSEDRGTVHILVHRRGLVP